VLIGLGGVCPVSVDGGDPVLIRYGRQEDLAGHLEECVSDTGTADDTAGLEVPDEASTVLLAHGAQTLQRPQKRWQRDGVAFCQERHRRPESRLLEGQKSMK
jgi:hypothetical protein